MTETNKEEQGGVWNMSFETRRAVNSTRTSTLVRQWGCPPTDCI